MTQIGPKSSPVRKAAPLPALNRSDVLGALILASSATAILPGFWPSFTDRSRLIGVLMVASAWVIAWTVGFIRFQRRHVWWLTGLGAVAASLLLSALLAPEPLAQVLGGLRTRMGAVYWIAIMVVAAGASSVKLDTRTRLWIAGIYVWAMPVAVVGLFQALTGQPVTVAFANDNLYGLAMVLLMPTALGLALTSRYTPRRSGWVFVAVVLAGSIAAASARAASGALVVELGLSLGLLLPVALPKRFKSVLRGAGLAVAGLVTAAMFWVVAIGISGPQTVPTWLARSFGESFAARTYIWSGAAKTFFQSPIVGHGPLGYQYASQRFIQPELMTIERGTTFLTVTPAEPHLLVLRALVAMGALGAITLCCAIWGWSAAIRGAKPPSSAAGALRFSFGIAVIGFALGSLFGPWLVTIGALPALMIGLTAAGFGKEDPLPDTPRLLRWLAGAALAMVFLGLAGSVVGEASGYARSLTAQSLGERSALARQAVASAPYSLEARFSQLWTQGDSMSKGQGDLRTFQTAVDADDMVGGYAPAITELVRLSLVQAQSSGRKDLAWEKAKLERAVALGPGIPDPLVEQLHLAIVSSDKPAIAAALAGAEARATLHPRWAEYSSQARMILSAP